MDEFTSTSNQSQTPAVRIGKVFLKRGSKSPGGGVAIVEVLGQDNGCWLPRGVIRLTLEDLGFKWFPCSEKGENRLKGRAVRAGLQALMEVA